MKETAFKLYYEIKNLLATTENAQISKSLTDTLGITLEHYNSAPVLNNQHREELKTMKTLLRKSDLSKCEYKKQLEMQEKNCTRLYKRRSKKTTINQKMKIQ